MCDEHLSEPPVLRDEEEDALDRMLGEVWHQWMLFDVLSNKEDYAEA